MSRKIICIICPKSCEIEAGELQANSLPRLSGYGCVRGRRYAEAEVTRPVRTVTTTVRTGSGRVVPVRTSRPVPKEKMFECMEFVKTVKELPDEIRAGTVLMEDICGTGADLIAVADSIAVK